MDGDWSDVLYNCWYTCWRVLSFNWKENKNQKKTLYLSLFSLSWSLEDLLYSLALAYLFIFFFLWIIETRANPLRVSHPSAIHHAYQEGLSNTSTQNTGERILKSDERERRENPKQQTAVGTCETDWLPDHHQQLTTLMLLLLLLYSFLLSPALISWSRALEIINLVCNGVCIWLWYSIAGIRH